MTKQYKNIIILGNSGSARECYMNLNLVIEKDNNIKFKGFLSFEGYKGDLKNLSKYFLCSDDDYTYDDNDYVIIGLGEPKLREKAYKKLKNKGVKFFNLIHPSCYIDKTTELGEANIFTLDCFMSCNCKVGNGNYFNGRLIAGHDVEVGDFNFVGATTHLLGNVKIGNNNKIGTGSVVLPNAKVGNNNKIAPLSGIYKGCKDNCYMLGNPAIKIGNTEIGE